MTAFLIICTIIAIVIAWFLLGSLAAKILVGDVYPKDYHSYFIIYPTDDDYGLLNVFRVTPSKCYKNDEAKIEELAKKNGRRYSILFIGGFLSIVFTALVYLIYGIGNGLNYIGWCFRK